MAKYIYRDLVRFYDKGYLIDKEVLLEKLERFRTILLSNIDSFALIRLDDKKLIKVAQDLKFGNFDFDSFDDETHIKRINHSELELAYTDKSIVETVNYINEVINKRVENKLESDVGAVLITYKNALFDILESFKKIYAFENKYKYKDDVPEEDKKLTLEQAVEFLEGYEADTKDILDNLVTPMILRIKDERVNKSKLIKKLIKFAELAL